MRIVAVEAVPLAVSFRETFRFGTTDRTTSPNVVVLLRSDDGHVGYGEACPVPAFTSETQASIVELVETRVAPLLLGRDPLDRAPLLDAIARVLRFAPFTIAAVDTALLDLAGRALGVPAHALLGGSFRGRVEVHGSVGWTEDPADMVRVAKSQAETYRTLKLYAGRGELRADVDRLASVRHAVGPDVGLFVDINGMWSPSDVVTAVPRLADIGITLLEQPLPVQAAAFQADLVATGRVNVIADEAVRPVADAAAVAGAQSATVVNVGHAKLGGPTAAFIAAQVAAAHGLGVMVGSVIELGIATAMGLHLAAALPTLSHPSYLMGPLKYREQVTVEQVEVVDSSVAVPAGSGLGVTVDEDRLRGLDARRR
jgi:L-alanine-DL-glutamate epimerase-like enolase superfamily enzyme